MKQLPKGNYALCIAHPGHELRLHGFLEQACPFVFIFTDGSHRAQKDLMIDSIRVIDKCTKHGKKLSLAYLKSDSAKKIFKLSDHSAEEGQEHLKDSQIYNEILNQKPFVFEFFIIDTMVKNLIRYKIDFLVSDSSEGTNVCHEMMNIMSDLAIERVKKQTGKQIIKYDFAIDTPFDGKLNDDCIHIQLDDAAVNRKLNSLIRYPLALTDLKPNISLDENLILNLRQMQNGEIALKEMIKSVGPNFLQNEYLRPYTFVEPSGKPEYEILGEKAVAAGKYAHAITYKDHLKPLKEKLHQLILGNAN